MPVIRKIYLHRLYGMKKLIPIRISTLLACILTGAFVGAVVFIKQDGLHNQANMVRANELEIMQSDHQQQIIQLEAQIAALNSRILHLAVDNKRLSTKSNELLQKLNHLSASEREATVR